MKIVYVIIEHCRGRKEITRTVFSSKKKAEAYCQKENSRPEPSMGWARSYSVEEWKVDEN